MIFSMLSPGLFKICKNIDLDISSEEIAIPFACIFLLCGEYSEELNLIDLVKY